MSTQNAKVDKTGKILFWLLVPVGLSGLIAALLHYFVSTKISIVGIGALIYALFTLIVLLRYDNWYRVPLLIVNLIMVAIFGFYQWQAALTPNWPFWTSWIGLGVAVAMWLTIVVIVIYRLGHRQSEGETESEPEEHPDRIPGAGAQQISLAERIIAAVKVAGKRGDLTVDVGRILEQMGKEAVAHDRDSRALLAREIREAIQMGLLEEEDLSAAREAIRLLLKIPRQTPEEASKVQPAEEQPPRITIDWGRRR